MAKPASDGRVGLQPNRERPARELEERIPVAGEYALQSRPEVAREIRALTS